MGAASQSPGQPLCGMVGWAARGRGYRSVTVGGAGGGGSERGGQGSDLTSKLKSRRAPEMTTWMVVSSVRSKRIERVLPAGFSRV